MRHQSSTRPEFEIGVLTPLVVLLWNVMVSFGSMGRNSFHTVAWLVSVGAFFRSSPLLFDVIFIVFRYQKIPSVISWMKKHKFNVFHFVTFFRFQFFAHFAETVSLISHFARKGTASRSSHFLRASFLESSVFQIDETNLSHNSSVKCWFPNHLYLKLVHHLRARFFLRSVISPLLSSNRKDFLYVGFW